MPLSLSMSYIAEISVCTAVQQDFYKIAITISNSCTKRRWAVQAIAGIFPSLMRWPLPRARTCSPCVLEREAVFALLGIAGRISCRYHCIKLTRNFANVQTRDSRQSKLHKKN